MYKNLNKNLLLYLYALLLLTFVLGILITEIFTLITLIFFFIKNRNLNYYKDKKFLFLLIFSIYIATNAYFQIPHQDLRISSFFNFRFALFAIAIVFILDLLDNEITIQSKHILKIIFFIIGFICLDAFIQFLSGTNLFGFEIQRYSRISGVFGSELILGSFLIKFFPIILWLIFFLKFEINKYKNFLIFFFSFYFTTIYFSGERTSIAIMFISIFLFSFFIKEIKKIFLKSFSIFLIFVIFISFTKIGKANTFDRVFVKTFNQITNQFYPNKKTELIKKKTNNSNKKIRNNILFFSKDHNGHYILAYKLFKESPMFGIGPKGFRYHCRIVDYDSEVGICSTHPHNIIMQILSEIGIVGLFFYLYGVYFIIKNLFFNFKKDQEFKTFICFKIASIALIINLFPFLPSGNFFNNWISIVNYYYIGLYLYSFNRIIKIQ
jgi:O-antigen ligase